MFVLDPVETRVLGSLIEKEIATPEYYPMTLNALVAASNQKSNRDPIVAYDEDTVLAALHSLRDKRLVTEITGAGIRVPKYREQLGEALNLGRREIALLCVLMLRGWQTVGELRERAGRLHSFTDLEEAESVLDQLIGREPDALVKRLPRLPGTKEPRYAHLLSGPAEVPESGGPEPAESRPDRISALESEVRSLREEIESLKLELARFRSQFE
jgi:uncharacterized protein YceH (UPF0502 family)